MCLGYAKASRNAFLRRFVSRTDNYRLNAFAIVDMIVANQTRHDFVASLLDKGVELLIRTIGLLTLFHDEAQTPVRVEISP